MILIEKDDHCDKVLIKSSGKCLTVPGCILYSRGGMVPHLTEDNLSNISTENIFWNMPLATIYQEPGLTVMKEYGHSFHDFSSTKDVIYLLNTNDSHLDRSDMYQYNEEKAISIWAPGGRRKITPEEYMKYFTSFQFDICIPPSDNIPDDTAKKRCLKSTSRTLKFLDKCLEIKNGQELTCPILGVIEGGSSAYEREKCAKEVAKRNVDGFIISGIDRIHSNWKELLQSCMSHLDQSKVKIMFGVFTPVEVIQAIEIGVHLFDTVIAYNCTERGCALSFTYTAKKRHIESSSHINNNHTIENGKIENNKPYIKDLSEYEIDLNEKKYFDDQSSIVSGCTCYSCTRYNRSYIHHLLVTKEMLAKVLLMIHNLHHWLSFMKETQICYQEDKLAHLKDILLSNN